MNDNRRNQDFIWQIAPGGRAFPSQVSAYEDGLAPELQKYIHVLGPTPKRCLETLADLGMSDVDIGRYFKMPDESVTQLRHLWKIDGAA